MMATGHALSGLVAGLLSVQVAQSLMIDIHPMAATVAVAMATGSALLPDIDHPRSTVTNSLGPVSRAVSKVVVVAARAAYHGTRTELDGTDDREGHRLLTHAFLVAPVIGFLVSLAATVPPILIGIAAFLAALGAKGIAPDRVRDAGWLPVLIAAAAGSSALILLGPEVPAWQYGAIVSGGVVIHALGDAITKQGAPLLWPIKIKGKRWYNVALPSAVRIRAGGPVERYGIVPTLMVSSALLAVNLAIPGGWSTLI